MIREREGLKVFMLNPTFFTKKAEDLEHSSKSSMTTFKPKKSEISKTVHCFPHSLPTTFSLGYSSLSCFIQFKLNILMSLCHLFINLRMFLGIDFYVNFSKRRTLETQILSKVHIGVSFQTFLHLFPQRIHATLTLVHAILALDI